MGGGEYDRGERGRDGEGRGEGVICVSMDPLVRETEAVLTLILNHTRNCQLLEHKQYC